MVRKRNVRKLLTLRVIENTTEEEQAGGAKDVVEREYKYWDAEWAVNELGHVVVIQEREGYNLREYIPLGRVSRIITKTPTEAPVVAGVGTRLVQLKKEV